MRGSSRSTTSRARWHRSGTEVDGASARWLADRAAGGGLEPTLERVPFDRLDPGLAYVETGGRRAAGVPLFDGGLTGPEGVSGPLGALGSGSVIGVTELGAGPHFMGLLQGTFGESLTGGWSIEERILGRLPVTIELGVMAIVIGLVIALPVGIYSAIRQDTATDYAGRTVAVIGLATASGIVILLLILVALFGGRVSPYPYNEIHLIDRLQGASSQYLLGTDQAGRDLLSRLSIPDWGGMLSREGRLYMEAAPWLAIWPGLCLTVTIYSLNMFGDAVRDLLDPRLRGGER